MPNSVFIVRVGLIAAKLRHANSELPPIIRNSPFPPRQTVAGKHPSPFSIL